MIEALEKQFMKNYAGDRTHQTFRRRPFAMGLLTFAALIAAGFILGGNSLASLEDRGSNSAPSAAENHRPENLSAIEITIDTETLSNEELKTNLDLLEHTKKRLWRN